MTSNGLFWMDYVDDLFREVQKCAENTTQVS